MRGAIFSSLASMGADMTRVLDLYAGSGALGIEALSRGGARCDFVERDHAACELIRANLLLTGLEKQGRVYRLAAARVLDDLEDLYTLVLADPPYDDSGAVRVLESIGGSALVEEGKTILVREHSARHEPQKELGALSLTKSLRHGDSAVSIYR